MAVRRLLLATTLTAVTALVFFGVGQYSAQRLLARQQAESSARIDALRVELQRSIAHREDAAGMIPAGTSGQTAGLQTESRDALVSDIKKQLQSEMGLLPVELLRSRRQSFVELYAYDNLGKTNYGTAGYLGGGYFITVKHGVIVLPDEGEPAQTSRRIESIRLSFGGKRVAATLRVSVRDAVYLAAAQSFAREVRLLPRAAGDRERAGRLSVGPELR